MMLTDEQIDAVCDESGHLCDEHGCPESRVTLRELCRRIEAIVRKDCEYNGTSDEAVTNRIVQARKDERERCERLIRDRYPDGYARQKVIIDLRGGEGDDAD